MSTSAPPCRASTRPSTVTPSQANAASAMRTTVAAWAETGRAPDTTVAVLVRMAALCDGWSSGHDTGLRSAIGPIGPPGRIGRCATLEVVNGRQTRPTTKTTPRIQPHRTPLRRAQRPREATPTGEHAAAGTPPGASGAAGHTAAEEAGQVLLPIMQRLGTEMTPLTRALMMDDFAAVTRSAAAIAEHAPISGEELERIHSVLGADMAAFVSCHEQFRERLRTSPGGRELRVQAGQPTGSAAARSSGQNRVAWAEVLSDMPPTRLSKPRGTRRTRPGRVTMGRIAIRMSRFRPVYRL